jgi:hypothetical protein
MLLICGSEEAFSPAGPETLIHTSAPRMSPGTI